jgi:uncharacterized protein (DUF983 family)
MTKIQAVINHKCPRCRKGDIFKTSAYSMKYADIFDRCSNCNLRYEVEPGFFYAAMYVSYVFIIAELVTTGVIAFFFLGESYFWLTIGLVITPAILLSRVNFRYSRTILLHFLGPIKYRVDKEENQADS